MCGEKMVVFALKKSRCEIFMRRFAEEPGGLGVSFNVKTGSIAVERWAARFCGDLISRS
jgi:hypothetical protein